MRPFHGRTVVAWACAAVFCAGASLEAATHEPALETAKEALEEYRSELARFRGQFPSNDRLPDVPFFLFGMGPRAKFVYREGRLIAAPSGTVIREWKVKEEVIVPHEYRVGLDTDEGFVSIFEDEQAVWVAEKGGQEAVPSTQRAVRLPPFQERSFPRILRVLHQELLINVIEGRPVPNLFVYGKPWYRDGAMMGMAFEKTGNLDLIRGWVLGLREPFDRNNAGETEADNIGQALYLISLVSDGNHPLVKTLLAEATRFEVRASGSKFIRGRSDFAEHPVYQTKWLKFGLKSLGLPDEYEVPEIQDSYSALFWWDYREAYVPGGDARDREKYPYLGWAVDHFHGQRGSPISARDYPLTWEQDASQARYEGMNLISPLLASEKIAAPHTWHAAEMFLYLLDSRVEVEARSTTRLQDEGENGGQGNGR